MLLERIGFHRTQEAVCCSLNYGRLFLFRGQETARFENGGQTAVTLEKS